MAKEITQRALHKGVEFPELPVDTIRIYGMRFCPFSQRVKLVLHHKKIKFQNVNINMKHKPDWFADKNPNGQIPVLEYNDTLICDSGNITDYIEKTYNSKPLLPKDASELAEIKTHMENFDQVISAFQRLFKGSETEKNEAKDSLNKYLDGYEALLTNTYFGGNEPNMLDFHIWPWFERIPAIKDLSQYNCLPESRFPKLYSWTKTMSDLAEVKESAISTNLHSQFFLSLLTGSPNYDVGCVRPR